MKSADEKIVVGSAAYQRKIYADFKASNPFEHAQRVKEKAEYNRKRKVGLSFTELVAFKAKDAQRKRAIKGKMSTAQRVAFNKEKSRKKKARWAAMSLEERDTYNKERARKYREKLDGISREELESLRAQGRLDYENSKRKNTLS